jgi:hypothetical protein
VPPEKVGPDSDGDSRDGVSISLTALCKRTIRIGIEVKYTKDRKRGGEEKKRRGGNRGQEETRVVECLRWADYTGSRVKGHIGALGYGIQCQRRTTSHYHNLVRIKAEDCEEKQREWFEILDSLPSPSSTSSTHSLKVAVMDLMSSLL